MREGLQRKAPRLSGDLQRKARQPKTKRERKRQRGFWVARPKNRSGDGEFKRGFVPIQITYLCRMNLLDDLALQEKWLDIENMMVERFGKKPNMEAMLYLIGMNELGLVPEKEFTKEQKQDLMHLAVCALLAQSGYYEYDGHDKDGWTDDKLVETPPGENCTAQQILLKQHIVAYFDEE